MFNIKIYVKESDLEDLKKRMQGQNVRQIPYSTQDIDKLNGYREVTMSYSDFMNMKENNQIYPINL